MLQDLDRSRLAERRHSKASRVFDLWLERAQQRGASAPSGEVDWRSYMDGGGSRYTDPRNIGRASLDRRSSHAALPCSPAPSLISPHGQHSHLGELEELLLMQGQYNHLLSSAAGREGVDYSTTKLLQVAPTSRPLDMPPCDATSSCLYSGVADSLYGAMDRVAKGGSPSVAMGGRSSPNEPCNFTQELMNRSALPNGGTDVTEAINTAELEAERYIARLEEEVQTLMREVSDKDRYIIAMSAVKDAMSLELREQKKRGELMENESSTRQMLSYSFMSMLRFYTTQAESRRAMQLETQISGLKYELKLAEAMLAQSQSSATAAASQQHQQLLKWQNEEDELARSVSATLRPLLQGEYDRLAQLVSEMPSKVRMMMCTGYTAPQSEEDEAARGAAVPPQQQQRLHEMLESLLASRGGGTGALVDAASSAPCAPTGIPSPPPLALSGVDPSHLVHLVSRVCHHHEVMADLYCAEVDQRMAFAQYEGDIIRFISAKQIALTWAALYHEKKDEVKHLNEKIMSLRGELRAAARLSRGVVVSGPNAGSNNITQSYEAYAAPYVPSAARLTNSSRDKLKRPSTSTQMKPQSVVAIRRPIGELREEARRLGVLPASHYPPLVTGPSPSMTSSASSSPSDLTQTLPGKDQKNAASRKRGGAAEAAVVPALVEVPTVAKGSNIACNSTVPVIRALPCQCESEGTSPSSALSHRASLARRHTAPRSVAQPKSRTCDSSQRFEATGEHSIPRPVLSDSSSSSSSTSDVLAAGRSQVKKAALGRGFALAAAATSRLASSSSASSGSSLSHAKAQEVAAKPTSGRTKQQPKPKVVHNSFDEDDSNGDIANDSSSSLGSTADTPGPASRAVVGSNTVRRTTAATQPSATRLLVSATTTTTTSASVAFGKARLTPSTAKQTRLKLPTW
ncbi:ppg3-related_protein-like_protein (plasmid) [Leishmania braziliensis MHOM/BR/75/M2904]|nr:ppg3-related_protein-like_protein [Leishmania braziliensis MHOM/BR/75/M2904]